MGNKFTRRRTVVDERYTRPQGLYQHREIDHRKLRRLILNGQLAPCFPGAEDFAIELDECPICFLFYPSLNRSKCCTKGICTECYLQIKSPLSTRPTQCPFCKTSNYMVEYRGAKTVEEKGVEQAEEQKVIEAKIRIRQKELHDEEERMLRRGENLQEDIIPAATGRFRRNFSNLHGFTLPTNGEEESELVSTREQDLGLVNASNSDNQRVQISQSEEPLEDVTILQMGGESGFEEEDVMPSRTARLHGSSFHRFNREDDFDLGLEEIMVMEAIWLSIQEQDQLHQEPLLARQRFLGVSGNSRRAVNENSTPDSNLGTITQVQDSGETRGVTGGLAGAIAALAERQVITVENRAGVLTSDQVVDSSQPIMESEGHSESANNNDGTPLGLSEALIDTRASTIASPNVTPRVHIQPVADRDTEVEQEEQIREKGQTEELTCPKQDGSGQELNNWIEVSIESGRALSPLAQRESRGSISDWMLDHSSEAVEVGTSFSSSVPSASDLPWEAPDFLPHQSTECPGEPPVSTAPAPMLPESFEEQMMLAMALSLAEAQAKARRC